MSEFAVVAGAGPALSFENARTVLRGAPGEEAARAFAAAERALEDGAWIAGSIAYDGTVALGVFGEPRAIELPAGESAHSPLLATTDRAAYDAAIATLQRAIYEGDVYQVNYTLPFAFAISGDPFALYASYAHRTGARYQAYMRDGAAAILSWSPELFLGFDGRRIETRPMKGTAPLERVAELDGAKNRAEHLMIVDLLRNDLHRVCNDVRAERLFAIERYPTFATMTSTIAGEVRETISLGEIFAATFPCGSVTGAPKRAAMRFIAENEPFPRDAYCGTIGYLSPQRRGWWNVAIRTAQIDVATGAGRFDAGGGIVADSTASEEWQEVRLKTRFFEPSGFVILETLASDANELVAAAHRRRMQKTARAFDVPFDDVAFERRRNERGATAERTLMRLRLHGDGRLERFDDPLERIEEPVRVTFASGTVRSGDPFLRHKTSWRPAHDRAAGEAQARGCFDALLANERGEITEGWRSNLFYEIAGTLYTPPVACGLLPGILRERLLADGKVRERAIGAEELRRADAIYVGNSARGLLRAALEPDD